MQRSERLSSNARFLRENTTELLRHFASGNDVNPEAIEPALQLIEAGTEESNLFRLASLTWSVPVSQGYGRRMRFLVWDRHNGRLIGLIALGDPVFNLRARDSLVGWTSDDRKQRLVNIMDAYVVGALPPYSMLLCGKLLACLVRTTDMRDHFSSRYARTRGIISGERKRPSLAMVTTSSALGRSSVYNRLKLGGTQYFKSIGYTMGWGHFHIPDSLFNEMRDYLRAKKHPYASNHRFGDGPNWRLRTVRAVLDDLGVDSNLLRHGVPREVFACELAENALGLLKGEESEPTYKNLLSTSEVATLALKRWIVARSERYPKFRRWKSENIRRLLDPRRDGSYSLNWISR
jgi:hypothetical protein